MARKEETSDDFGGLISTWFDRTNVFYSQEVSLRDCKESSSNEPEPDRFANFAPSFTYYFTSCFNDRYQQVSVEEGVILILYTVAVVIITVVPFLFGADRLGCLGAGVRF